MATDVLDLVLGDILTSEHAQKFLKKVLSVELKNLVFDEMSWEFAPPESFGLSCFS